MVRWSGSIEAQRQADDAWHRLKSKKKSSRKKAKKNHTKRQYVVKRWTYKKYMQSKAWHHKRQEKFRKVGHICEMCGNPESTQIHHLTYERLGHEKLKDLMVVCESCHECIHYDDLAAKQHMKSI